MYHVVEIDKSTPLKLFFSPHSPFAYKSTITASEQATYQIADYWTSVFGADATYNDIMRNVTSVVFDTVNQLDRVDTIENLTPNTFYFDYVSQTIYVHLPHYTTPPTASFAPTQDYYTVGAYYTFPFATVRLEHMRMHPVVSKSSWSGLQGGYTKFEVQL